MISIFVVEKTSLKAVPLSRKNIREVTEYLKEQLNIKPTDRIDIIQIFEFLSLLLGFEYEIVADNELYNNYAETDILNKIIKIRESVYLGASKGNVRDRFTIAHELGHFCLHTTSCSLSRSIEEIKIFEDPEWQANVFAAEFLVPTNFIKNLSEEEIANKYGVSRQTASIQLIESKKES